jgi:predicted Rossmann fold flavoprotein
VTIFEHNQFIMNRIFDVIVIGAGASGLMAAGRAGALGARVLLLEKMPRVGLKLGLTGKGRCNLTNLGDIQTFLESYYPDGRFLRNSLARFFNRDLMNFFEKRGVFLTVERGQRVFPRSSKAGEVVRTLQQFISENQVTLITQNPVLKLLVSSNQMTGVLSHQGAFKGEAVILATGGASYPKTGSAGEGYHLAREVGHTLTPIRPFLVPLVTREPWVKGLQGLSLKNVTATIWFNGEKDLSEFGEMLFTHFGLSGPIILTLSGRVVDLIRKGRVEISLNLKPALSGEQVDLRLQRELKAHHLKGLQGILKTLLPNSLIPVFIALSQIPADKKGHQITSEERARIKTLLTDFRLKIKGARPLEEAIVTAGGVSLKEVDPRTLESRIIRGLFFSGEVLDIQGKTGGYNLQAAFSTGWVAGESAAKKLIAHS